MIFKFRSTGLWLAPMALLLARMARAQEPEPRPGSGLPAESTPVEKPIAGDTTAPSSGHADKPATPTNAADKPGADKRGNGSLGEKSASEGTEVTVVGTRIAKTAGSAHVVKTQDLQRFKYDDPQAALRIVPGVYARGEDGLGLRPNIGLRGVNPDRSKKITLMEDGVLMAPAPYSAPAAYYFPLMARIARIFVLKGPSAITQGPQTVGGAINLMTRSIPASTAAAIDVATGEYGYGKVHGHFGSSDGQTGYLVEGVHLRSDGFKELPDGADTGFYRNEWMFKGRYLVDPNARASNEFILKATYADEVSNETYLGLADADFRAAPLRRYAASKLDRMVHHRTALSLTHVYEPMPNLSVTTTVYRQDFSRVWRKVNGFRDANLYDVLRNPRDSRNAVFVALLRGEVDSSSSSEVLMIGPNARDFVAHGIESRVRWNVSTGPFAHRLEYGMRLHYDRVERRHSQDGFRLVGGAPVPEGSPTVVTQFNEAWTEALALHVADAVSVGPLTLTPGVRIEAMRSAFVDRARGAERRRLTQVLLPGLGVFYAITDKLGALAGAYRGFSPTEPGAAQNVKPELSVNYEGGARYTDKRWRAEVIGFYNDYTNITNICTLSSGCSDENLDRQFDGGKARIYGVEAFAELAPVVGEVSVPITAAYTATKSEFLNSFRSEDPIFANVEVGDEMPYLPRHQATISAGLDSRYGGVAVAGTYVSPMREEAGAEPLSSTLATDEQVTLDVSANCRLLSPLTLYANVRNLLNEQFIISHRPFGARPSAPRWVQVGLQASF